MKDLIEGLLTTLFPRPCPLCRSVVVEKGRHSVRLVSKDSRRSGSRSAPVVGTHSPKPERIRAAHSARLACHGIRTDPLRSPSARSLPTPRNVREAVLRVKFGEAGACGSIPEPVHRRIITTGSTRPMPSRASCPSLSIPSGSGRGSSTSASLLARPLAERLGIPLDLDAVERVRHTLPQSASSEADRRKNLRGAVRVRSPERVKGRSILLLDDVYTTGATLEELISETGSDEAQMVYNFALPPLVLHTFYTQDTRRFPSGPRAWRPPRRRPPTSIFWILTTG